MEQSFRADLNHFQTFYWVARSGSFTAAARVLRLPKSTVSRQISSLETRLGTRLIERTTRRLALTEIGQSFLAHSERVMAEAEEAERAITAYSAEPRGLLRVGVPVTFARTFLAPLLPEFCRKYAALKLELVVRGGRMDPVEMLLDVVIHVGRLADSSYVVRKLGSIAQGLFASRAYLKSHPAPESPAGLAAHSIIGISRSPNGSRWRLTDGTGRQEEVRFDPRLAVADPVLAHGLAAGGLGIAMLPAFLTRNDRSLVPVLPEWRPAAVEFFALYPARQLTPPKLRVFLEELEARLSL